jgi:hypothetical protein
MALSTGDVEADSRVVVSVAGITTIIAANDRRSVIPLLSTPRATVLVDIPDRTPHPHPVCRRCERCQRVAALAPPRRPTRTVFVVACIPLG